MAGDDDPCGAVSLQSAHRAEPGLQTSVVGFEQVVRVGLRSVPGGREHLIEHPGVDPVPVGGDLDGRDPGPADRSKKWRAEEVSRRGDRNTSMTWPNWSMARNR